MALPIAEELLQHLKPSQQIAVLSVLVPQQYEKEYLLSQYIPKLSLYELRVIKASDSNCKDIIDAEIKKRLERNTLLELLTHRDVTPRQIASSLKNPAIPVEYLYDFYMKADDVSEIPDENEAILFKLLAKNPNITPEFLNQHPELIRDEMASNKAITLEYFEENTQLFGPNAFAHFAKNPNLTQDFILKYKDVFIKIIHGAEPCITPNFVQGHPEFRWNLNGLMNNGNFTRKDLEAIKQSIPLYMGRGEYRYALAALGKNSSLEDVSYAIDMVKQFPINNSFYHSAGKRLSVIIARHPKINIDIIINNLDFFLAYKQQDARINTNIWKMLSENRSISIYDILAHPELPWVPSSVNSRLDVDEFLLESPEYPYKTHMSRNKNITFDFILRNNLLTANDSGMLYLNAYTHHPRYVKLANEILNMT